MSERLPTIEYQACFPEWGFSRNVMAENLDGSAAQQLIDDLYEAYAEPQREYHTAEHIIEVVEFLGAHFDEIQNPRVVFWAALYHDAVYDPQVGGGENERRSAERAERDLRGRLPDDEVDLIVSYVLATIKHENKTGDPDLSLFLDADMAILGAPDARYQQYAGQVRREYGFAPYDAYRSQAGRGGYLAVFKQRLEAGSLFLTPSIHDALADQTLRNLEWESAALLQESDPFLVS